MFFSGVSKQTAYAVRLYSSTFSASTCAIDVHPSPDAPPRFSTGLDTVTSASPVPVRGAVGGVEVSSNPPPVTWSPSSHSAVDVRVASPPKLSLEASPVTT